MPTSSSASGVPARKRFDRLGWALNQEDLTSSQKFVLVVLADAASETEGTTWLAHDTISQRTCLGVSAVKYAIRDLEERGLLRRAPRDVKGRTTSNLYTLGCYLEVTEGRGSPDDPLMEGGGVTTRPLGGSPDDPPKRNQPEGTSQVGKYRKTSSSPERRPATRDPEDDTDPFCSHGQPKGTGCEKCSEEALEHRSKGTRSRNPDSGGGLAKYWSDEILVKRVRVTARREDIVRKFICEWLRRGVTPEVIRRMIDLYVVDPALKNTAEPWKHFLASASTLQIRAERGLGAESRVYEPMPKSLLALLEED